ncbi:MAG: hypothetical protein AB1295_04630 [Candidatus Micrarchaeota archaeon]
MAFLEEVLARLSILVFAPLNDQHLLWAALPLVLATLFMTLYFGKYSKEELGWNTAFGNTMVFLFVSLNLIQRMFYSDGVGSWDNVFSNTFYLSISSALVASAFFLMLITYYHLLPKRAAFFLFSAPPVNVSVYVLMTIIYAGVPADSITLVAAILLFALIFALLKAIQILESMASRPEGLELPPAETKEEQLLKKLKKKNVKLQKDLAEK